MEKKQTEDIFEDSKICVFLLRTLILTYGSGYSKSLSQRYIEIHPVRTPDSQPRKKGVNLKEETNKTISTDCGNILENISR